MNIPIWSYVLTERTIGNSFERYHVSMKYAPKHKIITNTLIIRIIFFFALKKCAQQNYAKVLII